jgi:hypothetical protein
VSAAVAGMTYLNRILSAELGAAWYRYIAASDPGI